MHCPLRPLPLSCQTRARRASEENGVSRRSSLARRASGVGSTEVFRFILVVVGLLAGAVPQNAWAQIKETAADTVVRYGPPESSRYRVGVSIKSRKGATRNILAMVAVPFTCAEQDVEIVEEDVTTQVDQLRYRILDGGARQMLVSIGYLPAGEEAHALVTFEVRTRPILPPEDTSGLHIPIKPDRQLKRFLGRSPYIETNHSKIKKALREIFATFDESAGDLPQTDWQRVEAIYDYVEDSIEYLEGPDKSALKTLQDGQGDCQAISALFVALCRTGKIPARIVWVHEHNYPEFCLEDADGRPHWFPCESSGTRAFGEMPLVRTILQKGDNFRVPERPRERLRYASDFLIGTPTPGSSKPRIRYIREQL